MNNTETKIYLTLPKAVNQKTLKRLQSIASENPIACLMLPENVDGHYDEGLLDQLVNIAHNHNIACLIENDYQSALKFGMDGIHITPNFESYCHEDATETELEKYIEHLKKSQECLGNDAIIGITCYDRHSAMTFGELGVQYIAFGNMGCDDDTYEITSYLSWWSELFEVPCVAWDIQEIGKIENLKTSGADFICLGEFIWSDELDANSLIKSVL